jgi:acetyl esterase/lipase
MDVAYLVLSINGAAYTVNAFRPIRHNRFLFVPSFFAGWITIELAWLHLLIQMVMTAWFARKGALRSRTGKLGLLITLTSWIGLLVAVKQSLGSRAEVKAVLKDLVPQARPGQNLPVVVERNLAFGRAGGKTQRLDVYRPEPPAAPGTLRPAVLQIHGGGWVLGDKREQGLVLLKHLAANGWVGFNANYRLGPVATFPDQLVDVKRALAWIREHADEYGIDPNFIIVTGGSAGGHLASLVALTPNDPEYQPGFEHADTSVAAAVPFYGVYDFTNRHGWMNEGFLPLFLEPLVMKASVVDEPEKFAKASPVDRIHADAPPFMIIHGSNDTLAPVEAARDFAERLRAVSDAPVVYLELKGAQHAFEVFPSIRANAVVAAVDQFLAMLHDQYLESGDAADVDEAELVEQVGAESPATAETS